jgi:phosphatidate phosphatase PAH1
LRVRRRKSEQKGSDSENNNRDRDRRRASSHSSANSSSSSSFDQTHTAVIEENGTEVLLIRSDLSKEHFPDSIKESRYSRSFIENQKRLEESQSNVTVEHLLKSSLDLDDAAKKKIEQVLGIGSKRFARELIELLESASRAVEQNANLLRILRHHLGLGSHSTTSIGNDSKKLDDDDNQNRPAGETPPCQG